MQMGETIKDTENDPLENNLGISWNLGPCHIYMASYKAPF